MDNSKLITILTQVDEGSLTPFKAHNEILFLFGVSHRRELLKALRKNHIHNFGNTPITINELNDYIDSL